MGRMVQVGADRLTRWVANFGERHGEPVYEVADGLLRLSAPDGAVAELLPPFPGWEPGDAPVASLLTHAVAPRRVGLLLVRKAAHAVGIVDNGTLTDHRVDRHYVQGRTKAGGWSQQRYARRRDNQATAAYADAADDAVDVLLPAAASLDAIVCGGDQPGVEAALADPRLVPLAELHAATGRRVLPVPDPRLAVLEDVAAHLSDIEIRLNDLA